MLTENKCDLESVLGTEQLGERQARRADSERETEATIELTRALAKAPELFFQKLVDAALELSRAESTGISLLNTDAGRFVWPALAGKLKSYIGQGTPSDFGPCGTVLDRGSSLLFLHPERHFTYLQQLADPLEEVLLIPFHIDGKAVGTIWAVIHEPGRKFDAEDKRLLENLSMFAATAYRTLGKAGALDCYIRGPVKN